MKNVIRVSIISVLVLFIFSYSLFFSQSSEKFDYSSDVSFTFFPQKANESISIYLHIANPVPSDSYTFSFKGKGKGKITTDFPFPPKENEKKVFEELLLNNLLINNIKYSELTNKVLVTYGWDEYSFRLYLCITDHTQVILERLAILSPLLISVSDYGDYYVLYNDCKDKKFIHSNPWHANYVLNEEPAQ